MYRYNIFSDEEIMRMITRKIINIINVCVCVGGKGSLENRRIVRAAPQAL